MKERKSISQMIKEAVENSVYCYSKEGGSGLVNKSECECLGKEEKCCQAYKDRQAFHQTFVDAGLMSMEPDFLVKRAELIRSMPEELKNGFWFKNNVEWNEDDV